MATPVGTAVEPFDKEHFLALFDRILPDNYLATLKEPGPGYEFLEGVAAMMARVSDSVAHEWTGQYIGAAPDGDWATGVVTFYRTGTAAGGYTIKAGTVVSTPDGYTFATTEDKTFGATDTEITDVPVKALSQGYLWNIDGPILNYNGQIIYQGISEIATPILIASSTTFVFDPYLRVRQEVGQKTTGGVDPMLAALGRDRGIERGTLPIDDYRVLLEQMRDTVTPAAMKRAVKFFMSKAAPNLPYDVIETWEAPYQTCYDAPVNSTIQDANFTTGSGLPQGFNSNVFVYDDPRPIFMNNPSFYGLPYRITNRYLDTSDVCNAFVVVVPDLDTEELNTSTYTQLAQLLTNIKPAGVLVEFILQGQ